MVNTNTLIRRSGTRFLTMSVLLLFAFKFPNWEYDKITREKVFNTITKVFHTTSFTIDELNDMKESFYTIQNKNDLIGYLVIAKAPSKFHEFDFFVLFDKKGEILQVEILKYRENYGAEICNHKWLRQFIGNHEEDYATFNRKVDGISGATLSVNNLKRDVFGLYKTLKEELQNHE